ncbi:MAG: hypothetical protein AAGB12_00010 [Pseudomonadota bacterium]
MKKKYMLTFDIDWAPDFAILKCLELVENANCKATFFATHDTPLNQEIISRGHTLGIHPNFLPGSSQGTDVKAIISECLKYSPNAWCMRTHALVQSSPLLHEIFASFPQLKLDVSLFMHRSPYAHKTSWNFDGVSFERLLYNWEDDAEFHFYNSEEQSELFFGDLTVFDFHPIHVFLNTSDGSEYLRLKKENPAVPLSSLDINTVNSYINSGRGTQSYLKEVLGSKNMCIELGDI